MPTCHPLAGQPDPEILVTCPYDPSHRVSAKWLQFHVTKCRRNHPGEKKECCYNATHMISEPDWDHHIKICPDRGVVDSFIYATSNGNTHVIEPLPEPVVPPNEENWNDENCGTYDPALNIRGRRIVHCLTGATRSERKKYRTQQRQKFGALDESVPSTHSAPRNEKKMKRSSHASEPLRHPHRIRMLTLLGKNPSQLASPRRSSASVISFDAGVSDSKKQRKRAA